MTWKRPSNCSSTTRPSDEKHISIQLEADHERDRDAASPQGHHYSTDGACIGKPGPGGWTADKDELPWTQAVATSKRLFAESLLKLIGQRVVLLTHDTVGWWLSGVSPIDEKPTAKRC